MKPLEDTLKCDADYYLDDSGRELNRDGFLRELIIAEPFYGECGYMIYLGPGFVPLRVAVIAHDADDAYDVLEYWCRKTGRLDEINEGPDVDDEEYGNYESFYQKIPMPVIITQYELDELG